MDLQVLQSLSNPLDPTAQARALAYFEQLKSSQTGWQMAISTLTNPAIYPTLCDTAKFFALQVIEAYTKQFYMKSPASEQQMMRNFLSQWIQIQVSQPVPDKVFIRNKGAQVFALVFIWDYPARWPTFFSDLLLTLGMGSRAVDNYLRVLLAIDVEVVDREVCHSKEEAERNKRIKDHMRESCVSKLVDSWYHIMTLYEKTDVDIVCRCLEVVGAYISWIDISLIANSRFVDRLVCFMQESQLREAAADCLLDIISKGMEPLTKTKLIDSLLSVLDSARVLEIDTEEDVDYLSKLARLVNGIGIQLSLCLTKLKKSGDLENAVLILGVLESRVGLCLRFLAHADDDVSSAVFDFAKEYIQLLKQKTLLNDTEKQHLETLLYIIFEKTKYDESFDFEHDGEEEAMFLEYRKQLRVLFDNLAALDRDLILSRVRDVVNSTLMRWQSAPFPEVEAALTFLYQLGEALPVSHGNHFSGDPAKASALQPMMERLLTCGVSAHPHPAVALCYMELVVRYEKFFAVEPQFIGSTLAAFLDERGMRHPSAKVRSRAAYLFSRFVRSVKSQASSYIEDVLRRIQDFLVLLPPENGAMVSLLSQDDQLFIFETCGIFVVSSDFEPERKRILLESLISPLLDKFVTLLEEVHRLSSPSPMGLEAERRRNRREALSQCLAHAIAAVSWSSKGFSNTQTIKACGCTSVYIEALQVFLRLGQLPEVIPEVQGALRQYLHRMVVCLGKELLPFVPSASQVLLKASNMQSLSEYIPLINQIITKFKGDVVPFLTQAFAPIVSAIFSALAAPQSVNDEEERLERQTLQRSYLSFVAAIAASGVTEVLTNQDPAVLHQVLLSLVQGAVEFPDPVAQKSCFSTLRKLVDLWGGKDGPPQFVDFMYKQIIPACFLAPLKNSFDLNDAQTVAALSEDALCLKSVADKRGDELVAFLQTQYLPTMKLNAQQMHEFCVALQSDQKFLKTYFKLFFQRARGL